MASVTSGLSAADSQNIIRATDALNRLTKSINSLEITNRELVKSTIKFNTLFKSIDNLDRGINRIRTSFVKAENRQTSQTISQKNKVPNNSTEIKTVGPDTSHNLAADFIKQNPVDRGIYPDKKHLYDPSYSSFNKELIDYIAVLAGTGPVQVSVPVGLLGVHLKGQIDRSDAKDENARRQIATQSDNYNSLREHKSTDTFTTQRRRFNNAQQSEQDFIARLAELNKALKEQKENRERLITGADFPDSDFPLGGKAAYVKRVSADLLPGIDNRISEIEQAIKDTKVRLGGAKGLKDDIRKNFEGAYKPLTDFKAVGVLSGIKTDSDDQTITTQTSVTNFESGQYEYDSFHESSRSSRYGSVQVAADYESSSDRKSAEFSSAKGIARDLTAKPKSAEDLIVERTEQQFRDIESLNTYAQSTEDYRLYQEARVAIAAQASEARQSIRQNEEQMDRQATLSGLNDMNSAVTGLMGIAEAARGKQSGTYKALFAMSKAFNVAQATLNLQSAIVGAMNSPENVTVAQKFASMAAVASAGVQLLTSITSITMSGQAHAGIDYIPREGTWLLDRGERVVDSRTNADLKQYLSKSNGGSGGGSSVSVNVPLSIQSESSGGSGVTAEDASILAGMIKSKVYEIVSNEQRPGGLLSRG